MRRYGFESLCHGFESLCQRANVLAGQCFNTGEKVPFFCVQSDLISTDQIIPFTLHGWRQTFYIHVFFQMASIKMLLSLPQGGPVYTWGTLMRKTWCLEVSFQQSKPLPSY